MKVAVNVVGSAEEPRMQVHHEQILATLLRPGSVEVLALQGSACEGDVARGRGSDAGCRRGLRLQNTAALCADVPSSVRSQPYRISTRIPPLEAGGTPV